MKKVTPYTFLKKQRFIVSLFIIFLANSYSSFGQSFDIKGTIYEDEQHKPLEYANIYILNLKDSTKVEGAITDLNGQYRIDDIEAGNYRMIIRYLGYQNINREIKIRRDTRYPKIELHRLDQTIQEVKIEGNSSPVNYKVDKKVVNARSFPEAKQAIDLLESIPSVQVDVNGHITYRGDASFMVYINNHYDANGATKLKQIPTNRIERIEVINNPSSKYDAEGSAGIINVILKKKVLDGVSITSSYQIETTKTQEGLLAFESKKNGIGWYLNGQYSDYHFNPTYQNKTQTIGTQQYNYKIKNQSKAEISYIEFGYNKNLSTRSYIDFSINASPIKNKTTNTKTGTLENQSYDLNKEYSYQMVGANISYDYKIDSLSTLSSNLNLSTYLKPAEDKLYESIGDNDSNGYATNEDNDTSIEFKVDYNKTFNDKIEMEAGGKVLLESMPQMASVNGIWDQETIIENGEKKGQNTDYSMGIYGLYYALKYQHKKLSLKAGVRYEYSVQKTQYSYQGKEETNEDVSSHFLSPSFHLLYSFTPQKQFIFNISRRIDRPQYWEITPLYQYRTFNEFYEGNSLLTPSHSYSIESAYQHAWESCYFNIETFYRQKNDYKENYRWLRANDVVSKPYNVGTSKSFGVEISTGFHPLKFWQTHLSTSLYQHETKADFNNERIKNEQLKLDVRFKNTFRLSNIFKLKYNLAYYSPEITTQYERSGYFKNDLSLISTLAKGKLQFILAYNSLFNTIKYDTTIYGDQIHYAIDSHQNPYGSFKVVLYLDRRK